MSLLRFLVPLAQAASITDKSGETASQSEEAVTSFLSFLWDRLDNWVAAVVVVVFSVYFAKTIKNLVVDRVADKMGDEHEEMLVLVGRSTYAAVLTVGMTVGLKVGGIDLTAVIAAVGFGIGFALQDIIMNFIAGVILLATRQFTIGDFIQVNGTLGKVKEIQARATILQALDGTKIIVPNADLFKNQVTSFTTNPFRRVEIPIGVEYRTDLKKATNVMLAVLHSHAKILKQPAPAVILDEFADSSINFKIRFWVESKSKWIQIKSDIIQMLKSALDQAGINIPFPIRTLVFDRDTESAVIPTYNMTQEEMKQHKIEQIQAQEDQATTDSANTALQAEYAHGDSHTEHVDLETLEEQHAAAEAAAVQEAENKAQTAEGIQQSVVSSSEGEAQGTDSKTQRAEGMPQEAVTLPQPIPTEPAATQEAQSEAQGTDNKTQIAETKAQTAEGIQQSVVSSSEGEVQGTESKTRAAVSISQEEAATLPQPIPVEPVATTDNKTQTTESGEQLVGGGSSDATPQPQSTEPEKVDATVTIAQVEPQQLATVPVAATEDPKPPTSGDIDGSAFLSGQ